MKYLILRSFLVACFSLGQGEFGCKLGCHIRNYRNCGTLPMSSNRKQNFLKIEWEVCPSCLYNIFYVSVTLPMQYFFHTLPKNVLIMCFVSLCT